MQIYGLAEIFFLWTPKRFSWYNGFDRIKKKKSTYTYLIVRKFPEQNFKIRNFIQFHFVPVLNHYGGDVINWNCQIEINYNSMALPFWWSDPQMLYESSRPKVRVISGRRLWWMFRLCRSNPKKPNSKDINKRGPASEIQGEMIRLSEETVTVSATESGWGVVRKTVCKPTGSLDHQTFNTSSMAVLTKSLLCILIMSWILVQNRTDPVCSESLACSRNDCSVRHL